MEIHAKLGPRAHPPVQVMMVHMSPSVQSLPDTLNSLRFGALAAEVCADCGDVPKRRSRLFVLAGLLSGITYLT